MAFTGPQCLSMLTQNFPKPSVCVCARACVCESARARESVCVCVCVNRCRRPRRFTRLGCNRENTFYIYRENTFYIGVYISSIYTSGVYIGSALASLSILQNKVPPPQPPQKTIDNHEKKRTSIQIPGVPPA